MVGPFPLPLVGIFFFTAWLTMIFWGIIAPDLGIATIDYGRALLVTIALWLITGPLATLLGARGTWMVGGYRMRQRAGQPVGAGQVNLLAVLSGSTRKVSTPDFRGGRITAVFGGVQLDLRDAKVEQRPAVLDITAVFGGAEIRVPRDWKVELDVSAILGGSSDERRDGGVTMEGPAHLVVTGTAIFGGVSIKD